MKRTIKVCFSAVFIIVFLGLYLYGSVQHLKRVNTDMKTINQSAYMDFAKRMHESKYTYLGGRNRMPVYLFLQSLFYNREMNDQKFFTQGKYINIILSLIILFCLFFIFRKHFNLIYSINLLLIVAFTVFMFKAAYFQCALLFYFLNFLCFLLMCKMLITPTWKLGIITGILLGITHLTKASILPGLALFIFFSIFICLYFIYCIHNRKSDAFYVKQCKSKFRSQLFCSFFVALAFIATIYPYISDSKRIFGHYFYNVNSTFYIWCDSWREAKETTRAHGDRVGWPNLHSDLIPSPKKYFREHSITQIKTRIVRGLHVVLKNCYISYGYFKYCLIYLTFSLFLILFVGRFRYNINNFSRYRFPFLFVLSYFSVYLLLYAWYIPIASGNRLILAQFLPFMFIISIVIKQYSKDLFIMFWNSKINILAVFNFVILCIFIPDLYLLMRKVMVMYGGL